MASILNKIFVKSGGVTLSPPPPTGKLESEVGSLHSATQLVVNVVAVAEQVSLNYATTQRK